MDTIRIDGLEVFAKHGVFKAEKSFGQKFIVSVELCLDLRDAGVSDDLNQTVSYAQVCDEITGIMTSESYYLIEKCAERIASHILRAYSSVCKVSVMIEKPWAPIGKSVRSASVQISRRWSRIYLSLGSNMGDTKATLESAIEKMSNDDLRVMKCSSYYKTKPVSDVPQDDYLNCVVEAKTTLKPRELITHLLHVESMLGRERSVRWGPRTIDIDVLTYDNIVSDHEDIIIPHPRIHERLFVLVPFCDLNPYYVHPLLNQRMIDLKFQLEKTEEL